MTSPSEFTIGDISGAPYQLHTHGGIVQQVKEPTHVHFVSEPGEGQRLGREGVGLEWERGRRHDIEGDGNGNRSCESSEWRGRQGRQKREEVAGKQMCRVKKGVEVHSAILIVSHCRRDLSHSSLDPTPS